MTDTFNIMKIRARQKNDQLQNNSFTAQITLQLWMLTDAWCVHLLTYKSGHCFSQHGQGGLEQKNKIIPISCPVFVADVPWQGLISKANSRVRLNGFI